MSSFLFLGILLNSMCCFVAIACCAVCDFWTVKNISGRFLVGLRWWSFIDEEGNEKWVFESRNSETKLNALDSTVFWYSQVSTTVFWALFIFWEIIRFKLFWCILTLICFGLSFTNLYAYYQCNADYKKKMGMYKGYGSTILNLVRGRFSQNS